MMKIRALLAAAPLAALLACEAETIDPNKEAQRKVEESQKNSASMGAPPPMIQANRTYRCKDNSLLFAEFYTNNTVLVRDRKDGPGTSLTAAGGQPPYTAEGYSLSANAAQISYTAPGKGTLSCKDS